MWSQKHELSTKQKIQRVGKKYVDGVVAAFRAPKVELPTRASPVPHLLHSNIPPSDAEVAVVKAAIDKAREEHTRILFAEAENGGSESRIEIYHREQIAEFIDQHQCILSSIRCFPQEILQHIFLYFADTWMSFDTDSDIDPRWAIGQVCHSWRAGALSLSSLWNVLPPLYLGEKKSKKAGLNLVRELLRRSGTAPLTVYIYEFGGADNSTHPIFILLLDHCERWRKLTISMSVRTLLGLQGIKGRLPLLEDLSMNIGTRDAASHFPPSLVDVFRVAPRLQEVTIRGKGTTTELSLPFSQLIRYETASKGVSLDNYPQLQAFSVTSHCHLDRIFQSIPTTPIVMSCTSLTLCASLSENLSRELRSIQLPFITDINIESDTPMLCRDLTFILFRSTMGPCMLTKLKLKTPYHDRMDLLALLRATPALVDLEAKISFYGIVIELSSTKGDRVFVPLLETCSFLICSNNLDDNMRLAVALFARRRCERPDGVGDDDDVRQVKTLEVHDFDAAGYFSSRHVCLKQTDFEPWRIGSEDSFNTELKYLEAFKAALLQELGPYGFYQDKKGETWVDSPKVRRVEKILNEIEGYKINDMLTLIRSELHIYLGNAFHLRPIPFKRSHGPVHEHARKIIQNWTHTVVPILPNIRWVFMREYSSDQYLAYIWSGHSVRLYPDANASLLLYGIYEPWVFRYDQGVK